MRTAGPSHLDYKSTGGPAGSGTWGLANCTPLPRVPARAPLPAGRLAKTRCPARGNSARTPRREGQNTGHGGRAESWLWRQAGGAGCRHHVTRPRREATWDIACGGCRHHAGSNASARGREARHANGRAGSESLIDRSEPLATRVPASWQLRKHLWCHCVIAGSKQWLSRCRRWSRRRCRRQRRSARRSRRCSPMRSERPRATGDQGRTHWNLWPWDRRRGGAIGSGVRLCRGGGHHC